MKPKKHRHRYDRCEAAKKHSPKMDCIFPKKYCICGKKKPEKKRVEMNSPEPMDWKKEFKTFVAEDRANGTRWIPGNPDDIESFISSLLAEKEAEIERLNEKFKRGYAIKLESKLATQRQSVLEEAEKSVWSIPVAYLDESNNEWDSTGKEFRRKALKAIRALNNAEEKS